MKSARNKDYYAFTVFRHFNKVFSSKAINNVHIIKDSEINFYNKVSKSDILYKIVEFSMHL